MIEAGARALHVLLVDDDEVDREAVRRLLKAEGGAHQLTEAATLKEASELIGTRPFDCLLLDHLLPDGSSMELITDARHRQPDAAAVVLTGQGDQKIAVELMKAGADDYLLKDRLNGAALWRSISTAVLLKRTARDAADAANFRKKTTAQLRALIDAAPGIIGARKFDALAAAVASCARTLLKVSASYVVLNQGQTPVQAASAGVPHDRAIDPTVFQQLEAMLGSAQASARLIELPFGSIYAVPIFGRAGQSIGALAVIAPKNPVELELAVDALQQLALIAAVSSDNIALYDAAVKAVQLRDDVMAIVSHDLRTPLSNVRLGAELLREDVTGEPAKVLERIDRSAAHMASLVNDLIDMVRIEGGKIDIQPQPEKARELVESATVLVAPTAEAAQIKFSWAIPEAPVMVNGDRHRVVQVLANLLGNAVKFTPAGGEVTVGLEPKGDEVLFSVKDTGCGIPEGEAENVFLRFWRSDSKRRRGLGLGLYIARGIVDAHGGRLWFESVVDRGTTFFFTLPKAPSPALAAP